MTQTSPESHYDLASAAEYLGVTLNNLRHHLRQGNIFLAPKIGNSSGGALITKSELDRFKLERRTTIGRRPAKLGKNEFSVALAAVYLNISCALVYWNIKGKKLMPHKTDPIVFKKTELDRFASSRVKRDK